MCDVKKYEKIYEEIKSLQPEDTLQLVLEAETEEQRSFVTKSAKYAKYAESKYGRNIERKVVLR